MADTSWTNDPKIKNMDPRKIAVLIDLIKEADGKPLDKVLPIFIKANKKLQKQQLSFNKDENEILIDLLSRNLSPQEKKQLEMLKNMISSKKMF